MTVGPELGSFSLKGRTAIVTGAAGLLGRQHVAALAAAGATVVCADIELAAISPLARETADRFGTRVFACALDVTSPVSVTALRDDVLGACGAIDVLVNNAAVDDKFESPLAAAGLSRFESYPLGMWQRLLEVNVTGVFLCSQILGTPMAERGSGSIVNVASTYGLVGPDQSLYQLPDGSQTFWKSAAYPASKGAVLSFTRFLAAYWGARGVRVNSLSPGGVSNGQESHFKAAYAKKTPLGRMADPTDYQGALVFLASDASRYMTGANLVVDGGFTAW